MRLSANVWLCLALLALVAAVPASAADFTNFSFEDGTSGLTTTQLGPVVTLEAVGPLTPTHGNHALFLGCGPGDLPSASPDDLPDAALAITGTFTVPASGMPMVFDYDFLTEELTALIDPAGPEALDFCQIQLLDGTGTPVTGFSIYLDTSSDDFEVIDGGGFVFAGPLGEYGEFDQHTGWQTVVWDLLPLAGQQVALSFLISDGLDTAYIVDGGFDSGLLIDNIHWVPEPGTVVLLLLGVSGLARRRRHR